MRRPLRKQPRQITGNESRQMAKILLIEDNRSTAESVVDALLIDGHEVEVAACGETGSQRLATQKYAAAIVDWDLPKVSGTEVIKQYRSAGGSMPILMLTGKDAIDERVEGLESGADDYLPKPFSIHELQARVRALLRRPGAIVPDTLTAGELLLDAKNLTVTKSGRKIELLPMEMALLDFLMRRKGQTFTPTDLLNQVWNSESESTEGAVRKTITRLRKKIDTDGEDSLIKSVRGIGYSIE